MQLCWSKWAPLLGGIFCDDHTGLYTILMLPPSLSNVVGKRMALKQPMALWANERSVIYLTKDGK